MTSGKRANTLPDLTYARGLGRTDICDAFEHSLRSCGSDGEKLFGIAQKLVKILEQARLGKDAELDVTCLYLLCKLHDYAHETLDTKQFHQFYEKACTLDPHVTVSL